MNGLELLGSLHCVPLCSALNGREQHDECSGQRRGTTRFSEETLLRRSGHSRRYQYGTFGVVRMAPGIRFPGLSRARSSTASRNFNPRFGARVVYCHGGTIIGRRQERRNQGARMDGRDRRFAYKACFCRSCVHGFRLEIRHARKTNSAVTSGRVDNNKRVLCCDSVDHQVRFPYRSSETR